MNNKIYIYIYVYKTHPSATHILSTFVMRPINLAEETVTMFVQGQVWLQIASRQITVAEASANATSQVSLQVTSNCITLIFLVDIINFNVLFVRAMRI